MARRNQSSYESLEPRRLLSGGPLSIGQVTLGEIATVGAKDRWTFDAAAGTVAYRWVADEPGFAMPVRVGKPGAWQTITPTTAAQTMSWKMPAEEFGVATDLYFVNVARR